MDPRHIQRVRCQVSIMSGWSVKRARLTQWVERVQSHESYRSSNDICGTRQLNVD